MPWETTDRKKAPSDAEAAPALSEAIREKIRSFFPRYETKRAVLLPALHVVQDAHGYVSWRAMVEIAELLEIAPSDVFDTVSFYTHFWATPRGKKTIVLCRSISCELMGGKKLLEAVKEHLGIDEHETTLDGKFSLATEECLAGCDHAPCMLINERLHKRVKLEDVQRLLEDAENDRIDVPRSTLFDAPEEAPPAEKPNEPVEGASDAAETTPESE
jgi:NADH-quinone oxidoreductase subunit E